MIRLAIVIPAYKKEYFAQALSSLAAQTNKDFSVYVGDDHSPDDLKAISDSFAGVLDIKYTRFSSNIGAEQLVHQWNRCIALTEGEEWLWLFSDDDLVDTTCVENFYATLTDEKHDFEVYRFNTCVIDANGAVKEVMPIGPTVETSEQMAYHLLLGARGNSMPDHIFSRAVYERNKGFVFTPYAQGADWAMSVLFSQQKGIYIIPDAKMYWRLSGTNISSVAEGRKSAMLQGHIVFIGWLIKHFEYLKKGKHDISYELMMKAAIYNLETLIRSHYKALDAASMMKCYALFRHQLGWPAYAAVEMTLRLGMHTEFFLNKLYRLNNTFRKLTKSKNTASAWIMYE